MCQCEGGDDGGGDGGGLAGSRDAPQAEPALRPLALVFLKLGTIAFGGPAAHVAMMREELVRKRKWLGDDEFLDLVGATNLIPGPNSTELAIHIGHARGGWAGFLVAGSCFIFPAAAIVSAAAWAYVTYGALPEAGAFLYGIKPPIVAIVAHAISGLARTAFKNAGLAALGAVAAVLAFMRLHELIVLFGCAGVYVAWRAAGSRSHQRKPPIMRSLLPPFAFAASAFAPGVTASAGLWPLFGVFVKAGAFLFGSGYVLLAFLKADLVERWGWLSDAQLMDAIAIGQVTPGPVFTTATFIGYVLAGPAGAAVATTGIFLPAFFFVALSAPFVRQLRRSATAGYFLDGVNVAAIGLMAAVSWDLGRAAIVDWTTAALAMGSAVALFRFGVNSTWLVAAGAVVGLIQIYAG
jgi:chromate transporter